MESKRIDRYSDNAKQTYSDLALSAVRAALGGLAAVDHVGGSGFPSPSVSRFSVVGERYHG